MKAPEPPPPAPPQLPLTGFTVVSLAVNLPGPVAASRLAAMGAAVTKVEPPSGDLLAAAAPGWYAELVAGQHVVTLDLKDAAARLHLLDLLDGADLLLTASRGRSLERLGLGWAALHERAPRLCQVAVVGAPPPHDEVAGHDLTYQAATGTLLPPAMPTVLVADLAGAERAVAESLAALLHRATTGEATLRRVALSEANRAMAEAMRWGLTGPGGLLGGGLPAYALYAARDGHVALAALEPHFLRRTLTLLAVDGSREAFAAVFATRTARKWETWAREHDVPLAAVRPPGGEAGTGQADRGEMQGGE